MIARFSFSFSDLTPDQQLFVYGGCFVAALIPILLAMWLYGWRLTNAYNADNVSFVRQLISWAELLHRERQFGTETKFVSGIFGGRNKHHDVKLWASFELTEELKMVKLFCTLDVESTLVTWLYDLADLFQREGWVAEVKRSADSPTCRELFRLPDNPNFA